MTSSEKLTTQSETFDLNTTVTIRHRISDDLETTVVLMFKELTSKTLHFEGDESHELYFSTDRNLMLMQFCIKGQCTVGDDIGQKLVVFGAGEYNIFNVPRGIFKLYSSLKEAMILTVFIDEDFFFKYLPGHHLMLGKQDREIFRPIFARHFNIKSQLKTIIRDIRNCEFEVSLKKLYLKAKVLELLTLHLVQQDPAHMAILKPLHMAQMAKVRATIDADLTESPSLAHLARIAGTNEQYLKKHFKLLYGNTVFGYMLSSKMQKAKEMLLNGDKSITEIAETVGYKHATHFTTAFKKFFGHLPKLIKTKFLWGGWFSLSIEVELFEMFLTI